MIVKPTASERKILKLRLLFFSKGFVEFVFITFLKL